MCPDYKEFLFYCFTDESILDLAQTFPDLEPCHQTNMGLNIIENCDGSELLLLQQSYLCADRQWKGGLEAPKRQQAFIQLIKSIYTHIYVYLFVCAFYRVTFKN